MHVLRGNLLAIQGLDMGRMAKPCPLRLVQLQDNSAQPPLSHRKGPGAITNLPRIARSGSSRDGRDPNNQ